MIMAVAATWGLQLLDDGYYYLQVAWNISRGAGSSFDGIHSTNGYHPLWQLMLVPVHWVCSKELAAWGATALQALLFCASGLVLCGIVRKCGGTRTASVFACGFWVMNFWLWGKGAMSGMETGVLLLLFGMSLHSLARLAEDGGSGWRTGLLLALATAARLDSFALVLAAALLLLVSGRRRASLRVIVPSAAYLAVYFPFNLLVFGGLTPVSGYVKSETGRVLFQALLRDGSTAIFSHAAGNLLELATLGGRIPAGVTVPALGIVLTVMVVLFRKSSGILRMLLGTVTVYGGALVLFYALMYPSLLGAYTYYWIPLLYGITAVVFASLQYLRPRWNGVILAAAAVILAVFDLVYAGDRLASYSFTVPPDRRPDAAGVEYLESLEGDVIIGSWDAGYLGYNCVHPVVNLDGLVSSYAYQRFLRDHGLEEWIRREGITYLANVDYWSGKRDFIEGRLGWRSVFEDTVAMSRPVSVFSLSPQDLAYASRELRIFYVYAPDGDRDRSP